MDRQTSLVPRNRSAQVHPNGYEHNSRNKSLQRCLQWLLIAWIRVKKHLSEIVGLTPRTNAWPLDGYCPTPRAIREGAGTWKALDVIYNYAFEQSKSLRSRLDAYWISIDNVLAVRNRLRLVKHELRQSIEAYPDRDEVRILELAAGSAQAVVEVIAELRAEGFPVRVSATLVDIDPDALAHGEEMAARLGVADCVTGVCANAFRVNKLAQQFRPDIIEMVGFIEYINDDQLRRLLTHIKLSLPPDGTLITAVIMPNAEQPFVHTAFDWPAMAYRTPAQLDESLRQAGWGHCRLTFEPFRIHCLARCKQPL
ncbi:MAG: class I SAM-dependent methyltransferase family protein [Salinibacter sp.]